MRLLPSTSWMFTMRKIAGPLGGYSSLPSTRSPNNSLYNRCSRAPLQTESTTIVYATVGRRMILSSATDVNATDRATPTWSRPAEQSPCGKQMPNTMRCRSGTYDRTPVTRRNLISGMKEMMFISRYHLLGPFKAKVAASTKGIKTVSHK